MFDNEDTTSAYSFNYTEEGGAVNRSISSSIDGDMSETWDTVLDEFLRFLGSVYGYDITEKVLIQRGLMSSLYEDR